MSEKIVEFKGKLANVIYHNDDFWILAIHVEDSKYPKIHKNDFDNVTLLGNNLFAFDPNVEYKIRAIEENGKRGIQYKYISCSREVPTNEADTRIFLETILNHNQVEELMREYPNVIELVRKERANEIDVSKLKGIKEKTLNKIVTKINDNFIYLDLCADFYDLISMPMIGRLYAEYHSSEKVKEKLKKDPYATFFKLDRVGFRRADEIILKMEDAIALKKSNGESLRFEFDKSFRDSKERCQGAVNYYLAKNEEEEGSTRMKVESLASLVRAYCPEAKDHLKEVVLDKDVYVIDNIDRTISFKETVELEKYIANKLISANKNPIKWQFEYEKYRQNGGFVMTDEQMSLFNEVCNNNFMVLTGNGGCVDCDTEFFNGKKWKKISEYEEGDKVLQYNEDGTVELVEPEQYHKYECDKLWEVKDRGVDMCLSDEHNVIYSKYGNLKNINFKEMREYHDSNARGFMGKFINTFKVKDFGLNLTDEQIQLISLLVIKGEKISEIDGSNIKITVSRSSQMIKIREILNANKIKWRENRVVNFNEESFSEFYFEVKETYDEFPLEWYGMNTHQFEVVVDTILIFEGRYYKNARFIEIKNKQRADFIQFAFTTRGYNVRITEKKDEEDNLLFELRVGIATISSIEMVETLKEKGKITEYAPLDGFKYCFTVPSHMWIMRRGGIVVVTGNSGKTQTVKGIVDMLIDNNISFAMAAPTARASKVIEKYTGIQATTIHRLLGWGARNKENGKPAIGPFFGEDNPLPYRMIIVDEVSMLDDRLCKYLLKAIDFKKTKLLFIGDPAQLSSVGMGNILHDIINSKKFPVVNLTKIFRYNEGGLIKVTTDIRNCKKYLNENITDKIQNFGNGYIFCPQSKEHCLEYAVKVYEKLVKKYGFDDVMMLSAQNVGQFGTQRLNKIIQEKLNHSEKSITVTQDGEETKYKLNDIVIMKKNTYDSIVCDENGYYDTDDEGYPVSTKLVANGEIGTITKITSTGVVIKYDDTYIWTTKARLAERLRLGYCISIHSSQGSQCDNVVVITPEAHSYMTNSNLLYVATSRCKKQCVHVGSMTTINNSIRKKQEITRDTNMKKMFINLNGEEE